MKFRLDKVHLLQHTQHQRIIDFNYSLKKTNLKRQELKKFINFSRFFKNACNFLFPDLLLSFIISIYNIYPIQINFKFKPLYQFFSLFFFLFAGYLFYHHNCLNFHILGRNACPRIVYKAILQLLTGFSYLKLSDFKLRYKMIE